jgi:hypothetical protein
MEKFKEKLKTKNERLWIIAMLARWSGLRIKEIVSLKKDTCKIVTKNDNNLNKQDYAEFNIHGKGDKHSTNLTYSKPLIEIIKKRLETKNSKYLLFPELDHVKKDKLKEAIEVI